MATGKFTLQGSHLYLDHLLRGIQKNQHTPYLAIYTTTPTQQGPGSEPSGGGYQRALLTPSMFTAPSGGEITTVSDIIFTRSTGWRGNVVGAGLCDSSVSGRTLVYWHAEDMELIEERDRIIVLAGGLTHRFISGLWSNNLKDAILNDLYRSIPLEVYPSLYCAHYSTAPTATAGGVEPTAAEYSRQAIAINGMTFANPSGGQTVSTVPALFPLSASEQGNQTHWGLHTDQSGGDYVFGGALSPARNITTGSQLELATGDIRFSIDKVV